MNSLALFDGLALGTVHPGQPDAEYHAVDAVSSSAIKTAYDARSPRALYGYMHGQRHQFSPGAAIIGSAVHSLWMEPDIFAARFVRKPDINRRTKAGKEEWAVWLEDNADKQVVTDGRGSCAWEQVHRMVDALNAHDEARAILEATSQERRELSCYATEMGLDMKARIDLAPDAGDGLYDLKTAQDASPGGFAYAVQKFNYHLQGAHYRAVARLCGIDAKHFTFVVVEKTEPYFVGIYPMSGEYLELGADLRAHVLERYVEWRAQVNEAERADALARHGYGTHVLAPTGWQMREAEALLEAAE